MFFQGTLLSSSFIYWQETGLFSSFKHIKVAPDMAIPAAWVRKQSVSASGFPVSSQQRRVELCASRKDPFIGR